MSYTIVYKTYSNDLDWFNYSIKSVCKYLLPFNNISKILIYSHDICCDKVENIMKDILIEFKIIPVNYNYHGYIKQMIIKALVFNDVDTKYVVYIDSDCIFTNKYELSKLINNNGKPYWYFTNDVHNSGCLVWSDVVKAMTNSEMKYYYMYNAFPFIVETSTLKIANEKFIEMHGKTYEEFARERIANYNIRVEDNIVNTFDKLSKVFSEFEYIGFIAHNFTNQYEFILNNRNKENLKQFWSHGGINNEILTELDQTIKIET